MCKVIQIEECEVGKNYLEMFSNFVQHSENIPLENDYDSFHVFKESVKNESLGQEISYIM